MTNFASIVAVALAAHGLTPATAAVVQIAQVPGITGDQAEITIGFDRNGKRALTAQVLLADVAAAEAFLADRDRIGALISQGVAAMPAGKRPEVPGWIVDNAEARRQIALRARASATAASAVAANDQTLPWAA